MEDRTTILIFEPRKIIIHYNYIFYQVKFSIYSIIYYITWFENKQTLTSQYGTAAVLTKLGRTDNTLEACQECSSSVRHIVKPVNAPLTVTLDSCPNNYKKTMDN